MEQKFILLFVFLIYFIKEIERMCSEGKEIKKMK